MRNRLGIARGADAAIATRVDDPKRGERAANVIY
jgi:hypothetical protein